MLAAAALAGASSSAALPARLAEVPRPDLAALEVAAREQIEEQRAALDQALASAVDAGGPALGARYGRLGRLYQAHGLDEAASVCYANARVLAPDEPEWPYLAGVLAERRGDAAAARELLRIALDARPDDLATLLRLAGLLRELGEHEEAGSLFRRSLEIETTAAAHFGLGRIAYGKGADAEAIERFERALELQPAADRIHYFLARAYRRQGETDAAGEHLARAGAELPSFPDPLLDELAEQVAGIAPILERALAAFAAKRYVEAAAAYREALALDPGNADARSGLELSLRKSRETDTAAETALELIELHPDDPRARLEVGRVLRSRGRVEESIEQLRQAVALDPESAAAHLELGSAYGESGDWERAAAEFETYLELEPGDLVGRYALARARDKQGRREEGIVLLRAIVDEEPAHVRARQELGRLLAEGGELAAAEAQHRAVLALTGASAEEKAAAHYQMARIRVRQERAADALAHDREAVRLAPALWQAHFALGRAMAERGRYAEAAERLRRVVELQPDLVPARVAEAEALVRAGRFADARRRLEEGQAELPRAAELAHLLARLLATAPDAALRDGERALDLASRIAEQFPAIEHAETVVMALAELGRFAEAVPLQERLVGWAAEGSPAELRTRLEANLARYRQGEKPRYP